MKSDIQLHRDVVEELAWQPSIREAEICVAVKDGVVTLSGFVGSYAQKIAAERAVMQLIAEGYTAPEIGEQLTISPKTVDTYKQRINDKLGLTHRADYVKLALKLGLLQSPPP